MVLVMDLFTNDYLTNKAGTGALHGTRKRHDGGRLSVATRKRHDSVIPHSFPK